MKRLGSIQLSIQVEQEFGIIQARALCTCTHAPLFEYAFSIPVAMNFPFQMVHYFGITFSFQT